MDSEDDTKKFLNHCCVNTFLSFSKNKLHEIFHKRWYIYKKQKWIDGGVCNNDLIKLSQSATYSLKKTLTTCNLDQWDITATCHAISIISKEITSTGGKTDLKEDKFVHTIRNIRNELSHKKDDSQLSDDERNIYLNRITNACTEFGMAKSEVYEEKKKAMQKAGILEINNVNENQDKAENDVDESLSESDANKSEYETCESKAEDASETASAAENPIVKPSDYSIETMSSSNNSKKDFERLKEGANKLFKANKYNEAIKVYSEILQLPNLSQDDQATIFSNRSAAHLMLKTHESFKAAQEDAEWAIQLWPCWWRGYYRLAQAQIELHELIEAEKSLKKALALNRSAKDVMDVLSDVRSKLGVISREEHLKPGIIPPSEEEDINDIQTRFGVSRSRAQKISNAFKNAPAKTEVEKGNRFRDGNNCEQNFVKAAAHYFRAAKDGNIEAMFNLGKFHNDGTGVKRDYAESLRWLTKAATAEESLLRMEGSGILDAQHLLGMKYLEGIGVEKDYKKAYEWFEKAFNNGHAGSGNNIGILYKNGWGVEQSGTIAFQWFKAAATLGDTQGMQNLAFSYFGAIGTDTIAPTQKHIAEGMKWLKQAANNGCGVAEREFERRKNHTYKHFLFDALGNMMTPDPSLECDPLDKSQHKKNLKEAAKNGSKTAQIMLDIYANEELAMEAFKKNDPSGVVAALSKAIHLNPEVVKVHDLLKSTIEERMKTHPEELDTVISYVHLNLNSTTFPELIEKYLPKFPNDKYFIEMQIKSFVTLKENFKALEVVNKALKLYPEDLRLLYLRAECLCMEDKPTEEALNAFDKFLVSAPKDHEKVPACHYRKSRYFYVNKNIEKYFECFEAGLSAEKKQLSCFMPYSFPNKELLEKIFNHEKQKFLDAKQLTSSSGNSTIARSLTLIKQNPQRKPFILKHREVFGFIADKILGTGYVTAFQLKDSPNIQTKFSKTLKNITLKDMDPTTEKIYDGFKMDVKIVDYGFLPGGIAAIIEDVNGDLQKIGIYNWPSNGAQVLDFINAVKTFRPNVKLTIINPYMRMAISGTSMIRVDNPVFLKLDDSDADNKCSCCGKEAKVTECKNCQMSRYCSKECQKYDLNELNHNQICKHLKTCKKF